MRAGALGLLVGLAALFAQPAASQDACAGALASLDALRNGHADPKGARPGGRLVYNGYGWKSDEPLLVFDGFRDLGDVRRLCPKDRWPDIVTDTGRLAILSGGMPSKKRELCSDETWKGNTAVGLIQHTWMSSPDSRFFADRVKELQGRLDAYSPDEQSADRHASDAEWLRDAARDLVGLCKPNDEAKKALASAEHALKVARENQAFVACAKAREAIQPQIQAFDAMSKATDIPQMKTAFAALDSAAKRVKAACAPSEEGARETEYIVASKKMAVLFRENPACLAAGQAMNQIRQAINASTKDARPALIAQMRQEATAAKAACGGDPSPEVWGHFVAWIAERNLTRIP